MDRYARRVAVIALAVAIAALIVAIFDGDGGDGSSGDGGTGAESTAAGAAATAEAQLPSASTTAATIRTVAITTTPSAAAALATTTTTSAPPPVTAAATPLRGEDADELGPAAGTVLNVIGVGHDSDLNLRDEPAGDVIETLLPLTTGIVATGNTQRLPTTIWHEVRLGEITGWASSNYLAPLGATSDVTSDIIDMLDGTPGAETMTELGRLVAGLVASDDPPSRIRISGAPVVGDVGEITMDVVGLPDDSVRGFRLLVVANVGEESESFSLRSVESTVMCVSHRGVTAEGLCR